MLRKLPQLRSPYGIYESSTSVASLARTGLSDLPMDHVGTNQHGHGNHFRDDLSPRHRGRNGYRDAMTHWFSISNPTYPPADPDDLPGPGGMYPAGFRSPDAPRQDLLALVEKETRARPSYA